LIRQANGDDAEIISTIYNYYLDPASDRADAVQDIDL